LADSSGNPPPLRHELPYFATGLNSSPWQPETSPGNVGRFGLADENQMSRTMQTTPSAPVVPVGFKGGVSIPNPGFAPELPDLDIEKWWDHTKRGHMGLWNYLRSFRGGGGGRDEEEDCDERYEREKRNCYARKWRMPAHYMNGCLTRAESRWLRCLGNGGKPHPDELDEWGDKDEETGRNFGR
jgi:hypothetical protein